MSKQYWNTAMLVGVCVSFALTTDADAQKGSPVQTAPSGAWSAVGTGIVGVRVADLVVFGSELIAAGSFSEAGGQSRLLVSDTVLLRRLRCASRLR